jgi:16S rRNA (uracil1498-N3)-methyltransferase
MDPYAPLLAEGPLALSQSFVFGEALAQGLRAREVRPKEAFTVQCARTGGWYRASLVALDAQRGEALAYERLAQSPESEFNLVLVCAVLGRQRMLPVAQKCAELGCSLLLPVLSEYAVPRAELDKEKPWAWQGQATKGARQCRRGRVPQVVPPMSMSTLWMHTAITSANRILVLDDVAWEPAARAKPPEGTVRPRVAPGTPPTIVLAVGPEGGWSAAERSHFASIGAERLQLGPRVLRAETAVFAGLAIVQYALGDLSSSILANRSTPQ